MAGYLRRPGEEAAVGNVAHRAPVRMFSPIRFFNRNYIIATGHRRNPDSPHPARRRVHLPRIIHGHGKIVRVTVIATRSSRVVLPCAYPYAHGRTVKRTQPGHVCARVVVRKPTHWREHDEITVFGFCSIRMNVRHRSADNAKPRGTHHENTVHERVKRNKTFKTRFAFRMTSHGSVRPFIRAGSYGI